MTEQVDPQTAQSIIQAIGGALFGGGGVLGFLRLRAARKSAQEQRCEHICGNMVAALEMMLAVLEAVGSTHPGLNPAIINARVKIEEARRYLDGNEL